mgnify:CR=1 FL=1
MYRTFRPFRLQSPSVAPTAWPVFHSRTYRRNRSEERVPPTEQGSAGVSWASPWDCWLAATKGRIEFVILRTSRSPPDALHLPSRGRSFVRLRQPGRPPAGTRTLLVQYTCNRTAPGGSRWDDAIHHPRRRWANARNMQRPIDANARMVMARGIPVASARGFRAWRRRFREGLRGLRTTDVARTSHQKPPAEAGGMTRSITHDAVGQTPGTCNARSMQMPGW